MTEPAATGGNASTDRLWVVALGASAGGLDALRGFLEALPEQTPDTAYVVLQHLSPDYESALANLLSRYTRLNVATITDGAELAGGTVYITPASQHLELDDGCLRLLPVGEHPGPRPSINRFLGTLAHEVGERAIAVILSGTGSDGAQGVREVKAAGGGVFVQDTASARYDGMPAAARATGCVDRVDTPGRLAELITNLCRLDGDGSLTALDGGAQRHTMDRLIAYVEEQAGVDISLYKATTLHRRLKRRMTAVGALSLNDYYDHLLADADEARLLCREILISVTRFFRDRDRFEALEGYLTRELESLPRGADYRVWVPGCATGEEVYSLAFLLLDIIRERGLDCRLRLFGTDLDGFAIAHARAGHYDHAAVSELDDQRVERYFTEDRDGRRVSRDVREMITFARHNLLTDPPFPRIHLVSCRNLLIYFETSAKQRAIQRLHYAMRPEALLWLGKSEQLADTARFSAEDERLRLYRRRAGVGASVDVAVGATSVGEGRRTAGEMTSVKSRRAAADTDREVAVRALTETYAPPGLLVDEHLEVLHFLGDCSDYIRAPRGAPSHNARELLTTALRTEFALITAQARRQGERVSTRVLTGLGPGGAAVRLVAVPAETGLSGDRGRVLVLFETVPQDTLVVLPTGETTSGEASADSVALLERDLREARSELSTVKGEYDITTEELETTNEELQSSNEELQSSNEELQTTNEELQATNEELTTVNEELNQKTEELESAYRTLRNVKNSLRDPLVVVDHGLRVQLVNHEAYRVFRWDGNPEGSDVLAARRRLRMPSLKRDLQRVLERGVTLQREVQSRTGDEGDGDEPRYFVMQIAPYLDADLSRRGAILTFRDISELQMARRREHDVELRLRSILDQSQALVCLQAQDGSVFFANHLFRERLLTADPRDSGLPFGALMATGHASFFDELVAAAWQGEPVERELAPATDDGSVFLFQAFPVRTGNAEPHSVCVMGFDITQRRRREAEVRLQATALDAAPVGISIADATREGFPLLYVNEGFERMTGYTKAEITGTNCRFLQGPSTQPRAVENLRRGLAEHRTVEQRLINHRRDGSLFWNELTLMPLRDDDGRVVHYLGIQRDITREVNDRRDIELARSNLAKTLAFAGVGNFEWDVETDTIVGPSRLWELLGLPAGQRTASADAVLGAVYPDDRRALRQALSAAAEDGGQLDRRVRLVAPDGTLRWLHLRAQADVRDDGSVRLLGLIGDITARQEMENAIEEARLAAESASRAKSQFLSNMSHELRTPLNAVLGFSQVLEDEESGDSLTEDQRESVERIREAGEHLLHLVSEILDLARIESGRIGLTLESVDVRECVAESVRMLQSAADARGIAIECEPTELDTRVQGDHTRLVQVVLNVVSNAVKYNRDDGRVTIRYREVPPHLGIEVSDTGHGIAETDFERVFEPFNRLGQETRGVEGTGIGLVVCRRLVESMGGEIVLASVVGEGSRFTIWLPRAAGTAAELEPDAMADTDGALIVAAAGTLGARHFVFLGRNAAPRTAVRTWLGHADGWSLEELDEPTDPGVVTADDVRPDLLLVEIDGLPPTPDEVVAALRNSPRLGAAVRIALTVNAGEARRQRLKAMGFAAVLALPMSLEAFLAALQATLAPTGTRVEGGD